MTVVLGMCVLMFDATVAATESLKKRKCREIKAELKRLLL